MFKCLSCGGTFEAIFLDGTRYFHACPPAHRARVRRGAVELVVDLAALLPTDIRLEEVFTERANRRDENVVNKPGDAAHRNAKREGAGRI